MRLEVVWLNSFRDLGIKIGALDKRIRTVAVRGTFGIADKARKELGSNALFKFKGSPT